MKWICLECGKEFNKKFTSRTREVRCPKCKSGDVEPVKALSLLFKEV